MAQKYLIFPKISVRSIDHSPLLTRNDFSLNFVKVLLKFVKNLLLSIKSIILVSLKRCSISFTKKIKSCNG